MTKPLKPLKPIRLDGMSRDELLLFAKMLAAQCVWLDTATILRDAYAASLDARISVLMAEHKRAGKAVLSRLKVMECASKALEARPSDSTDSTALPAVYADFSAALDAYNQASNACEKVWARLESLQRRRHDALDCEVIL